MIKNNKNVDDKFKVIQLTNEKFKKIKDENEYFVKFLTDIGFTKISGFCPMGNDAKFKYMVPEVPDEDAKVLQGNIKNIQHVFSIIWILSQPQNLPT